MFTSNIGGSKLDAALCRSDSDLPDYETIRKHYMSEVRRKFVTEIGRPELLNRFGGNIVVFDIIRPEHIPGICRKFFGLCGVSAKERHGLCLEFDDSIVEMIRQFMRQPENLEMGGRRIKTLIEELVLPVLNRWVLVQRPSAGQVVRVSADGTGRILVNGQSQT
jgi:ATP-dependent Clp protease ATP-binding subunit ClpA